MVRLTLLYVKCLNCLTEFSKPSTRTLFQTIQKFTKTTHLPYLPLSNKPRRLLHVNFFLKISMYKDILDIKLIRVSIIRSNKRNKQTNRCQFNYKGKSIKIINAINLSLALSYKTGLQSSNKPIRIKLYGKHQTTTNSLLSNR